MTSDIVLAASQRSVLLALQETQSLIDTTQLRLSTGRSVNTALDNPDNYFASRTLSDRAADLNLLLDGIGQAVSTIELANSAVTSVEDFILQAQALTVEALDLTAQSAERAGITGNEDLSDADDLTTDISGIDDGDRLIYSFVDNDNTIASSTVTITGGDSINDLLADIQNINDSGSDQVFDASLSASGQLEISTLDGSRFSIEFEDSGTDANEDLVRALGLDIIDYDVEDDGAAAIRFTINGSQSLTSVALYEENGGSGGSIASLSTTLSDLTISASGSAGDIFDGDSGDDLNLGINGGATQTILSDFASSSLQDFLDAINNGSYSSQIEATYDTTTGELNIRAISNDVDSIQFEIEEDASGSGTAARLDLGTLGFGTQDLQNAADGSGNSSSEIITLGSGGGSLSDLETQYNSILTQIDALVSDSEFNGYNLLDGEEFDVVFNEDRSNVLTVSGVALTVQNLGLDTANFGRQATINESFNETDDALQTVRNFGSSLSTDLAIIQTREIFAEDSANTFQSAADKLINADQNEEGANLLALQTRLQLGVTALSLSTVSQQSVLRLF